MAIDRTNYNALVDDDGSNTLGSIWNKLAIKDVLLDPIDAAIVAGASAAVSSGQIPFPATQAPSSNPNTLDDYEEGTWGPVLGGLGGTSGQSYAVQVGTYTKIGRLVIASFEVTLNTKGTITSNCVLQNLPFPVLTGGTAPYGNAALRFNNLATNWITVGCILSAGNTYGFLQGLQAAGPSNVATNLFTADISNTTTLSGTLIYPTT